ncbi:peptidylprolyl isomerase [Fischerella sp. PCC 9605]|uniref:peptidylprolyl isomerase n=2 Tax=unclassified Fischerella TaxID=494603 RepID=UPI00047B5E60|nr:peptidylprolyl isomerase [Fischerella sp. PCC 9605]
MVEVPEIADRTILKEELISLVASYQLLPQLLREMIVEGAIASISCTQEEVAIACQKFLQQHQITNAATHEAWLRRYGMTHQQFQALATRKLRIEKFQQQTWGHKLESYFLERKKYLDRVVYSMIRTQDPGIAQELYFRIQAREQSFGELAKNYSVGPEAYTNGIVGPVEMGTLHPGLARQLQVSQPGQLWHPISFGEYFVIIQLEKLLPAQLNAFMRQRLLRELFEDWLQEQIQQLPASDQAWLVSKRTVEQINSTSVA